ncbi:MAG: CatB-related O-acetyltransferase [Candidatus Eremiobacteraeota bacterium]|nr:CatB-related O-acetyltransferase [Candidatus Eremiobacteraeota bacterium]
MNGPDPNLRHPIAAAERLGFLKNFITNPRIEVGDFTYYDDPAGPQRFEQNVLYHFDFIGDRLRIGKFCAIAAETKFVMNGGSHRTAGFSTYPFSVFGSGWSGAFEGENDFPSKGDTVVENDVWIGYDALIMPGVRIGNGAVIATRSVVTADVADYAIAGGNPAVEIRKRFDGPTVEALLEIAWWNWEAAKIARNLAAIGRADLAALRAVR